MEKLVRYKAKNKKQPTAKPKTTKKRKSDGPTCSMFLAEMSRKLAAKKREENENPTNIVQKIIESLTNALPVKISRKTPSPKESPIQIDTLQALAPELLPSDTLTIPPPDPIEQLTDPASEDDFKEVPTTSDRAPFKMPKMPILSSEVIKVAVEKRKKAVMQDASINTGSDHDAASEIAKHVNTLKKISLIAEEFNQKTAKNLKEIVDSVQEDLVKKLEEMQTEQRAKAEALAQQLKLQEQAEKEDARKEE